MVSIADESSILSIPPNLPVFGSSPNRITKFDNMGKTKHSKIALRCPTNIRGPKKRKDYQDNERPKNKPRGAFSKYGLVMSALREDFGVVGHRSNGNAKRIYSKILRRKIKKETRNLLNEI